MHLEGLTLGTLILQILYQISRGEGGYSFQTRLGWGKNLFNLAKMVVLVLHKEAESNVEKLKYMKYALTRPRKKKTGPNFHHVNKPSQVSFTVVIDFCSLSLISEE